MCLCLMSSLYTIYYNTVRLSSAAAADVGCSKVFGIHMCSFLMFLFSRFYRRPFSASLFINLLKTAAKKR